MRPYSSVSRRPPTAKQQTGPSPAWMRSLEEKYKRLHMKILFDASAYRHRTRFSGAFSTVSTLHARRNHKQNVTTQNQPSSSTTVSENVSVDVSKDARTIDNVSSKTFENTDQDCLSKTNDAYTEIQTTLDEHWDKASQLSLESQKEDEDLNMNSSVSHNRRGRRKSSLQTSDAETGFAPSAKHSVNRPIPDNCEVPGLVKQEPLEIREPMGENRESGRRKTSKLFQRLSKEAQIAIDETRKENDSAKGRRRESMCLINNFTNHVRTSRTEQMFNNNTISRHRRERPKSCALYLSASSTTSSTSSNMARPKTSGKDKNRLPDIMSSRTNSTFKSSRSKHVLVPGVGKYQIPLLREQTFRITGADYDIRYHDVIRCGRRDSSTPPTEILEQAINKCQEWLTKHVVYVKR